MGSNDGMKEPPSKIRRWIYRSRLGLIYPEYRKHILFLLVIALLCCAVYYFARKSGKAEGISTREAVPREVEDDAKPAVAAGPPVRGATYQKTGNQRLFYNRVPKCGSSTLVELLKKLAVKNGFQHTSSPLLDDWAMFTKGLQTEFVKNFMSLPARSSFDRHLFFLDFKQLKADNPIYINMIRDPTERFISEFYFRRRLQNEGTKRGEIKWYDEDLENCVRTGKDYDCRLVDGTLMKNMIAFFCGHDIECSKHNSAIALSQAKANVKKYFSVVGVLEDLEMTLQVLERKLPAYFAGALDLHSSSPDHVVNKGKNRVERVSEEVKQMIRANLTAEYQFYDFIKTRLIAQSNGEL